MKHVLLLALIACASPATQPPPVTPAAPPPAAHAPSQPAPASTTEPTIDAAPIESDAPVEPKPAPGPAGAGGGYGHGGGFGTITKGRYAPIKHGHVPTVSNTPPQSHAREKIAIRHEIKKHIFAIQACYDTALATKPDLAGTVNTTFTIEPDGVVSSASGSGVDPEVATCVANELKTIQFRTADIKTVVNYPFVFRPPLP